MRAMAVIDVHAHLDERMLDVPSIVRTMAAHGVDKVALIPTMNDPLPETPEALLTVLRRVMCSPLHSLASVLNDQFMTPSGDLRLGGRIYRIYAEPDNATVAAAIAAHPERFLGWIFLNPAVMDDPVEELERWRQTRGFIGVKLHPHWHGWPIEAALPIARRCEELRLPILIHLGFGARGRWELLTRACPRLKIIFAHAGMPHYQRMWDAIRDDPNLFLDVSSPYLGEHLVRAATRAVGATRVLYGTDAPYGFHTATGGYDWGAIKGWVHRLPIRARAIDRVLGDNVEELLAEQR
jgi:predicted TIM-barrel fold metal-dependent hydrolase